MKIVSIPATVKRGVISGCCLSNCSNFIFSFQHSKSYENGTHRFRLQKPALPDEKPLVSVHAAAAEQEVMVTASGASAQASRVSCFLGET